MFTEWQCRPEQLVEINQFSNLERKWKTEKFFRPRIENFYGCTLRIAFQFLSSESDVPFLQTELDEDGYDNAEGAIVDMLDTLSTKLNFTYIYGKEDYTDESYYDFVIGASVHKSSDEESSYPIYSLADVFVVPPGELFTPWEKLFMPFDSPTWTWLVIVFAFAFLVILLIKWSKSTSMYEFVIGSNVTAPTLNVVAIFMGIGQILLPQRNVSRFMFMSFILFCLIMRTAYQGKYFEFLTSDMRRKPIQTIEELREKNFTAIMTLWHASYFYYQCDLLEG